MSNVLLYAVYIVSMSIVGTLALSWIINRSEREMQENGQDVQRCSVCQMGMYIHQDTVQCSKCRGTFHVRCTHNFKGFGKICLNCYSLYIVAIGGDNGTTLQR